MAIKITVILAFIITLIIPSTLAADPMQENIFPITSAWVDGRDLDAKDVIDFLKGEVALQNFIGTVPGLKYEATTLAVVENGKLVYGGKIGNVWYMVEDPI